MRYFFFFFSFFFQIKNKRDKIEKKKKTKALSTSLAEVVLFQSHARKVTLNIEKPSALLLAQSAGVKITRFQNQLQRPSHSDQSTQHKSHISYISLGSNLGERANNISQAIDKLVKDHSCTLLDTSFLYETSPVHIKDQPKFLNAVCKVIIFLIN